MEIGTVIDFISRKAAKESNKRINEQVTIQDFMPPTSEAFILNIDYEKIRGTTPYGWTERGRGWQKVDVEEEPLLRWVYHNMETLMEAYQDQ